MTRSLNADVVYGLSVPGDRDGIVSLSAHLIDGPKAIVGRHVVVPIHVRTLATALGVYCQPGHYQRETNDVAVADVVKALVDAATPRTQFSTDHLGLREAILAAAEFLKGEQ